MNRQQLIIGLILLALAIILTIVIVKDLPAAENQAFSEKKVWVIGYFAVRKTDIPKDGQSILTDFSLEIASFEAKGWEYLVTVIGTADKKPYHDNPWLASLRASKVVNEIVRLTNISRDDLTITELVGQMDRVVLVVVRYNNYATRINFNSSQIGRNTERLDNLEGRVEKVEQTLDTETKRSAVTGRRIPTLGQKTFDYPDERRWSINFGSLSLISKDKGYSLFGGFVSASCRFGENLQHRFSLSVGGDPTDDGSGTRPRQEAFVSASYSYMFNNYVGLGVRALGGWELPKDDWRKPTLGVFTVGPEVLLQLPLSNRWEFGVSGAEVYTRYGHSKNAPKSSFRPLVTSGLGLKF